MMNKKEMNLILKHQKQYCKKIYKKKDVIAMGIELLDWYLGQWDDWTIKTKDNLVGGGDLYLIAHAINKGNSCYDVHDDWRKKIIKDFKRIIMDKKKN